MKTLLTTILLLLLATSGAQAQTLYATICSTDTTAICDGTDDDLGALDRVNEDVVDVLFDASGAVANACELQWKVAYDPRVYADHTAAIITTGGVQNTHCTTLHGKASAPGYDNHTSRLVCVMWNQDGAYEGVGISYSNSGYADLETSLTVRDSAATGANAGDIRLGNMIRRTWSGGSPNVCGSTVTATIPSNRKILVEIDAGDCTGGDDIDGDTVCDPDDNCTKTQNLAQTDGDEDGYGNQCDSDVDQNCVTGASDLSIIYSHHSALESDPWTLAESISDINDDGGVGAPDSSAAFSMSAQAPGPTGDTSADCNP